MCPATYYIDEEEIISQPGLQRSRFNFAELHIAPGKNGQHLMQTAGMILGQRDKHSCFVVGVISFRSMANFVLRNHNKTGVVLVEIVNVGINDL